VEYSGTFSVGSKHSVYLALGHIYVIASWTCQELVVGMPEDLADERANRINRALSALIERTHSKIVLILDWLDVVLFDVALDSLVLSFCRRNDAATFATALIALHLWQYFELSHGILPARNSSYLML